MSGPGRSFIFCSKQNPRLLAFTLDPTGSNLPRSHGPWQPSNSVAAPGTPRSPDRSLAVMTALESRGFYLSRPDGNAW
jgi:hypothetical protein